MLPKWGAQLGWCGRRSARNQRLVVKAEAIPASSTLAQRFKKDLPILPFMGPIYFVEQ
jgi:hypothetical protein